MERTVTVLHSIPGRIRLQIPLSADIKEFGVIEELLSSITGIERVHIENITHSMIINYDANVLKVKDVLHYVSLLFLFIRDNRLKVDEGKMESKSTLSSILSAWSNLVLAVEKNLKTNEKIVKGIKISYKILIASISNRKKR